MIPINRPWLSDEEKKEILMVLDEGILTSPALEGGKRVQEFESLLRSYLNIKHVIAVNSGTSALLAALLTLGLKEGDEVTFTFVHFRSISQFCSRRWRYTSIRRHNQG